MWDYLLGFLVFLQLYKHVSLYLIKWRLRRRKEKNILPGAEPFFLKGGKTGVLLLHGFTATPNEMRELGHFLKKRGLTVYAPLLAGHGTTPEHLFPVKYDDWLNDVEQAIHVLEGTCNKIFLVGNSFGGNLIFMTKKHPKVKGRIALATPFIFKREGFWKAVFYAMRQVKLFQKKYYTEKDKKIYAQSGRIAYDQIPLPSLTEVLKVVKKSREKLHQITTPTLLMQSTIDDVVSSDSITYAYKNLKTRKKEIYWIKDSIHVFITDKKRMLAFRKILKFIKSI